MYMTQPAMPIDDELESCVVQISRDSNVAILCETLSRLEQTFSRSLVRIEAKIDRCFAVHENASVSCDLACIPEDRPVQPLTSGMTSFFDTDTRGTRKVQVPTDPEPSRCILKHPGTCTSFSTTTCTAAKLHSPRNVAKTASAMSSASTKSAKFKGTVSNRSMKILSVLGSHPDGPIIAPETGEGSNSGETSDYRQVTSCKSGSGSGEPSDCRAVASRKSEVSSSYASKISSFRKEFRSKHLDGRRHRCALSKRVWQLMDNPDSSDSAYWLSRTLPFLNAAAVVVAIFSTTRPSGVTAQSLKTAEVLFDSFFGLEIFIRFVVCPNYLAFFVSFTNWIDILASVQVMIREAILLSQHETCNFLLLPLQSIMPVMRLLKMLRRFPKFHLLTNAFWLAFEALPVLLFTLSTIILSFSALLFLVEPEDNIASLTEAVWFVLVTVTTVGYGDVTPRTVFGELISGALIICGSLYMSMPLGIVGGSFNTVWDDRDRLLLMQRTRERLLQWGYAPKDIPELFYAFDKDKSGELDVGEFCKMISEMQLGISEDRIVHLFKLFDSDESGSIDDSEFVRTLFPKAYIKIYGSNYDGAESRVSRSFQL